MAAILAFTGGQTAEAATVRFDPITTTVYVGNTFSLDIVGRDFTDAVDGGGISFSFDSTVVVVTGVTVDTGIWDFFTSVGAIDNTPPGGDVADILFNTLQTVIGDFAIATVTFQAVGAGSTGLVLAESALNPFAGGGNLLTVALTDGQVQVTPEPPMWALLPVAAFLMIRRNRKGG